MAEVARRASGWVDEARYLRLYAKLAPTSTEDAAAVSYLKAR